MIEDVLSRASKVAEQAEVFLVSVEETPVHLEANRLKHIQTKQSTTAALRIIRGGRTGYATTTHLDNIETLVNNAVETAQFGAAARFELPPLTAYPPVEVFDPRVPRVTTDKMVKLGEDLIARLRAHTPELICEAGVTKATVSMQIMNSHGGRASYEKTVFSLGVEGTLIRDTDMLFVGESQSSCRPLRDTKAVADVAIRQLELARERAAAPTGQLPVIFTPDGVASALVSPLMAAFNGKTVLEGASPVGGKLGVKVFDEKFSLRDDPTAGYRPNSRPCDDEGVPSQGTSLIERGVVTHFLYDLQTAALAHTRSTGSASRARGSLPAPSPSAFVIGTGDTSFEDMLADVREGLVIEQLLGAEQGNILGGDFGGNVLLGYRVENGRIVGRVKDTMVAGNVYQLLKEITAIGREGKWVGGFLNAPHIYCSGISVSAGKGAA